jgi:hypothetical protein
VVGAGCKLTKPFEGGALDRGGVTVSFSMLPGLENCCALGLPVKMGESIDVARSAERLATEGVLVRKPKRHTTLQTIQGSAAAPPVLNSEQMRLRR